MSYYICYITKDRLMASQLNQALVDLGEQTLFVDRGQGEIISDPTERIMNAIKEADNFIILYSRDMSSSMLSHIEITYAKNKKKNIILINADGSKVDDAIVFEIGKVNMLSKVTNMTYAAKHIIKGVK